MSWTQKRACPRATIRLEAAYEDERGQVFLGCRDISEQGIYLCATDAPVVGAWAKVVLDLPGCRAILQLRGRVMRRDIGPEFGFVVCFDHEDRGEAALAAQTALRRFVDDTVPSQGEPS
jgi:hypothetical protein